MRNFALKLKLLRYDFNVDRHRRSIPDGDRKLKTRISIYARCDFGVDGHHPSIFYGDLDSKLII